MIRNTVCVEVTCDDCRQPLGGDEGPVHYANFDDARKWNEDWVIRDDGHATCGDCGDRDTCSREGHQWQPGEPRADRVERRDLQVEHVQEAGRVVLHVRVAGKDDLAGPGPRAGQHPVVRAEHAGGNAAVDPVAPDAVVLEVPVHVLDDVAGLGPVPRPVDLHRRFVVVGRLR